MVFCAMPIKLCPSEARRKALKFLLQVDKPYQISGLRLEGPEGNN